jgi:hypothetical protein
MTTWVGKASTSSPSRKEIMILNRSTRARANFKLNHAILAVMLLVLPARRSLSAETAFFLILDPIFYRSALTIPLEGTKETVFAFYRLGDEGSPVPAKQGELSAENQAIAIRQTKNYAQKLLERTEPDTIRDTHGVITALRLQSEDSLLSAILLLPEIGNRYENLLGPDCLFAVPNRHTVFLFPRLASDIQSFSATIQSLYHNDPWPVSTEIFEIADGKLRVRGRFSEDF